VKSECVNQQQAAAPAAVDPCPRQTICVAQGPDRLLLLTGLALLLKERMLV
jgi:hypothetical protein